MPANKSLQRTAPAPCMVMPLAIGMQSIAAKQSVISLYVHHRGWLQASRHATAQALPLNCYVNVKEVKASGEYTFSDICYQPQYQFCSGEFKNPRLPCYGKQKVETIDREFTASFFIKRGFSFFLSFSWIRPGLTAIRSWE